MSMQFYVVIFYSFSSRIQIRILNADPDTGRKRNADPCGSGLTALLNTKIHNYVLSFIQIIFARANN